MLKKSSWLLVGLSVLGFLIAQPAEANGSHGSRFDVRVRVRSHAVTGRCSGRSHFGYHHGCAPVRRIVRGIGVSGFVVARAAGGVAVGVARVGARVVRGVAVGGYLAARSVVRGPRCRRHCVRY